LLDYERLEWTRGRRRLAGVDEAGRGPLAGPVVAAAVLIERDFLERERFRSLHGLTDSKRLSAVQRDHYFEVLSAAGRPVVMGVGVADVDEIDQVNILRATHLAMARAVAGLPELPDHLLVDGLAVAGLPCSATFIVGGDGLSCLIAAASVIAKVSRDRMMVGYDRCYPQYGFAAHKGYGTRRHSQALLEFGPCPIHRRSFAPVRDLDQIRLGLADAASGAQRHGLR
jgi:ribonuclease HII